MCTLLRLRGFAIAAAILGAAAVSQASTMPFATGVDATSNVFAAGLSSPGGWDQGSLPPFIALPAGTNRTIQFSSVTGSWWNGGGYWTGPEGQPGYETNVGLGTPVSNLKHHDRGMYLGGVFLDDAVPTGAPPASLEFSTGGAYLHDDFLTLSPLLRQTFFIGDGLTGTGSGALQTFRVPDGATRLFFGVADGYYLGSGAWPDGVVPGYYWDNTGSVSVHGVASTPEPGAASLLAVGALLLALRARRRSMQEQPSRRRPSAGGGLGA